MAPTTEPARRYGWRPSLHDPRDLVADPSGIRILAEVDPRGEMTPIYDQFRLGACTANADPRVIDYDRIVHGEAPFFPSRLGIYFYERKFEGQPATADTGAYGRDGFKAARKIGMWREADWPYVKDVQDPTHDPHFFTDPASRLGPAPLRLERPYKAVPKTEHAIKAVLSNKQMISFGFSVFESFESPEVAKTGIMPTPQHGEQLLGGHQVVAIGYLKSEPHYVLCANSWGNGWGIGGCFLMPWSYLLSRNCSDLRTVYRPA